MRLKKGAIKKSIGIIVIIVLTIGLLIPGIISIKKIFDKHSEDPNYTFILNNQNMNEIVVCEKSWHYELNDGFIPCIINNTIGGIGGNTLDWELSPQDNCNNVGGMFPGYNLYNDTRGKELYDLILPKCHKFNDTMISNNWLNASMCVCIDERKDLNLSFTANCDRYDCGGGLIIIKK